MNISEEQARGYILSFMSARCDVRSQHKLPSVDEIKGTVMAEIIGADRATQMVQSMIDDGTLIDYDGYISDHPIDVL